MIPRTEAIVVGAGIGGLAAALALQKAGADVRVFEQAPALGEVGAGISISPNGALGLRALGVLDAFREHAYAPEYQFVRHYQSARVLATVTRGDRLAEAYGERYYVIHRADLHRVLADAVRAADPDAIVTGERAIAIEQVEDGVEVAFESGLRRRADLLVGADGVRSRVRSILFGAEQVRFTGFVAWRGLVPIERVPLEAMDPPSQVFIGPGHMINRYPVRGGQLLNFVAFAERPGWEEEGWSIPAKVDELATEFAGWHPWVTQLIAGVPEQDLFKWALCARSPLMRWVSGRAALLGDAAHPLLPYLGQGAVMAIEDAVLLGRACVAAADVPEALARYEASRVGRARFVVERSTLQVPRFHSPDPDGFHHDVPVDEALGLFAYDPAQVPV
ncbi:MAG: FAD-dependent monooxygenase [Steroidobacteraceae bacterium]|jgi:salicylate hydroxylase|nr:FAD-dependent monooxygenase [Steroidobacteraceae bacterium]